MSSKFAPSSESSSTEVDLRVEVPESEDDIRAILQVERDRKLLQALRKGQQKKPKGTREKQLRKMLVQRLTFSKKPGNQTQGALACPAGISIRPQVSNLATFFLMMINGVWEETASRVLVQLSYGTCGISSSTSLLAAAARASRGPISAA